VLLDPAWPLGCWTSPVAPYGVVLHAPKWLIRDDSPLVASSLRYVLRHAQIAICAAATRSRGAAQRGRMDAQALHIRPDRHRTLTPLDPDRRSEVRERLGLSPSALLVSSYSRLVPRKGMDTLIRASTSLTTRFPELQVAIGGVGRDRGRLERLATKLGAPVVFLGRVPTIPVPLLGASDLMVMACRSRWRGSSRRGLALSLRGRRVGCGPGGGPLGGSHEACATNPLAWCRRSAPRRRSSRRDGATPRRRRLRERFALNLGGGRSTSLTGGCWRIVWRRGWRLRPRSGAPVRLK